MVYHGWRSGDLGLGERSVGPRAHQELVATILALEVDHAVSRLRKQLHTILGRSIGYRHNLEIGPYHVPLGTR